MKMRIAVWHARTRATSGSYDNESHLNKRQLQKRSSYARGRETDKEHSERQAEGDRWLDSLGEQGRECSVSFPLPPAFPLARRG